jgi:hypothetical protein
MAGYRRMIINVIKITIVEFEVLTIALMMEAASTSETL